MHPVQLYIGLFFGALAAGFLLLAIARSSRPDETLKVKVFVRISLAFAIVSFALLIAGRFLR